MYWTLISCKMLKVVISQSQVNSYSWTDKAEFARLSGRARDRKKHKSSKLISKERPKGHVGSILVQYQENDNSVLIFTKKPSIFFEKAVTDTNQCMCIDGWTNRCSVRWTDNRHDFIRPFP